MLLNIAVHKYTMKTKKINPFTKIRYEQIKEMRERVEERKEYLKRNEMLLPELIYNLKHQINQTHDVEEKRELNKLKEILTKKFSYYISEQSDERINRYKKKILRIFARHNIRVLTEAPIAIHPEIPEVPKYIIENLDEEDREKIKLRKLSDAIITECNYFDTLYDECGDNKTFMDVINAHEKFKVPYRFMERFILRGIKLNYKDYNILFKVYTNLGKDALLLSPFDFNYVMTNMHKKGISHTGQITKYIREELAKDMDIRRQDISKINKYFNILCPKYPNRNETLSYLLYRIFVENDINIDWRKMKRAMKKVKQNLDLINKVAYLYFPDAVIKKELKHLNYILYIYDNQYDVMNNKKSKKEKQINRSDNKREYSDNSENDNGKKRENRNKKNLLYDMKFDKETIEKIKRLGVNPKIVSVIIFHGLRDGGSFCVGAKYRAYEKIRSITKGKLKDDNINLDREFDIAFDFLVNSGIIKKYPKAGDINVYRIISHENSINPEWRGLHSEIMLYLQTVHTNGNLSN